MHSVLPFWRQRIPTEKLDTTTKPNECSYTTKPTTTSNMNDDEAAPPDNISSSSPAAAPPTAQATTTNNESGGTPSPHHHNHHRRSKREKYSPSRFVARPSNKYDPLEGEIEDGAALKSEGLMEDNVAEASATAAAAAVDNPSVAAVKSDNEVTQLVDNNNNNDDDGDDKKPRRRTPRAHAAPGSYAEPPDVEEDFDINEDDDINNVDTKQPAETIITKTCNDTNQTTLQISTIKRKNPKTNRSLCKVIGCGKADQVGNEGFCRTHFNLVHDAVEGDGDDDVEEGEEIDEEMEEEEEEDKKPAAAAATSTAAPSYTEVSPSKPRLNTTIRILSGEFATLTGRITNIKIGGWCTIANPKVTKPIRMSNMEVVAHNGPPPTPVKRDAGYLKRKFDSISPSRSRGRGSGGGGRPVRERKPPQSLLASPMSSSLSSPSGRPRRSVRGGDGGSASSSASPYGKRDSSVRRSKRGPTPSPRFHHDHDDEDDDDEEEEVVRPRGRRGRPSSSTPSTTPAGKKSVHLCKAPTCPKFRQGCCEGYCTTCFRLFKSGALFDSPQQKQHPPAPQRGGSASRNCRARNCSKFNQYNCEGYCMKHYREFVLEGGEEEEEEEEVVGPPKKRARRAIKHEVEEEEEEELHDDNDDDDESPFDATIRTGGSGRSCRRYCKVKRCDKWSQGQPKNGMCFKHFGQYGFGDGTTMTTTTKKKRSRSRSSAVAKSTPSAAVADEIDGEIGVGSLVMVKERMGAGINKPGGVGRVTKVYSGVDDEEVMVYDVKYILGGREKG
eukprot:scaffold827_cov67-Skeletonema_dohrnii-CCMP3373.AAC.1